MAQVGERTFIEILLEHLMGYDGIKKFIFCTGYEAETVERHVKGVVGSREFSGIDIEMYFSRETYPMGTGGCLIGALRYLGGDPAFVFNGDTIHRIDPLEMFRGLGDDWFGTAYVDGSGVFCGSFLFEKEWLDRLPTMRPPFSLEDAIGKFGGIKKIPSPHPYFDIGTPSNLESFREKYA